MMPLIVSILGIFIILNAARALIKGKGYIHALLGDWGGHGPLVKEVFAGNMLGLFSFYLTLASVTLAPLLIGYIVAWSLLYPLELFGFFEVRHVVAGTCASFFWMLAMIRLQTIAKSYNIPENMLGEYPADTFRNLVDRSHRT